MDFSSLIFLLYFLPIALIGYYGMFFSRKAQNIWLLLISFVFYAWGEPIFVFGMIGLVLFNWICGLLMETKQNKIRKLVFGFACFGNIFLLCAFKYTNFIIDSVYDFIGWKCLIDVPEIVLPMGISFLTFQSLSYIIDIYKKDAKVQKNLLDFGLYVTFFPKLIAGPIIQYNAIERQIRERKTSFSLFSDGCTKFAIGLVKKIFVADNLSVIADNVFSITNVGSENISVPAMLAWVGAIAYSLQLYYDFSGYSDMAIGLGKMFGFEFEENFDHPFVAKSLREFMSRWHISLSKWFAQYVYHPLGGSRVQNEDLMVRNLFIVWLLTGIWHGASWTFIAWGIGCFVVILIEKVTGWENWKFPAVFKHFITLFWVVILFTLFRTESINQFFEMAQNMFALNENGIFSSTVLMLCKEYGVIFLFAIIFLMPVRTFFEKIISEKKTPIVIRGIGALVYVISLLALIVVCMVLLVKDGCNPFVYFKF